MPAIRTAGSHCKAAGGRGLRRQGPLRRQDAPRRKGLRQWQESPLQAACNGGISIATLCRNIFGHSSGWIFDEIPRDD
jgi:hypothetical protein